MNIKEAAIQIKNAMRAYFAKDEFGNYWIPPEKQRPVFLCGAPGIGKTAIMEQIAQELGVGLISYSMTHHTRQSAIGLPLITKKKYGEKEYHVSEYTMSEIIASVYDFIEETKIQEGILFLDEINCVSETLMPSMLRFLQYKSFGAHQVPKGWIVVTAGNPPEFNSSVKEFDIATLDRLKKIDIEPVYEIWREYAKQKGVHKAILRYLDDRPLDFYLIENTPNGKNYVTARGWEDLSQMLCLYERLDIPVDEKLVAQYLNHKRITADFTDFYLLFVKHQDDFHPKEIMEGRYSQATVESAAELQADDRIAITESLLSAIHLVLLPIVQRETAAEKAIEEVKLLLAEKNDFSTALENLLTQKRAALFSQTNYRVISKQSEEEQKAVFTILEEIHKRLEEKTIKEIVTELGESIKKEIEKGENRLQNTLAFLHQAFGEAEELTIFTTGIAENFYSAKFLRLIKNKDFLNVKSQEENKLEKMIQEFQNGQ